MSSDFYAEQAPFDFEALLTDAVGEILRHEDPQKFLSWMRDHLPDYDTEEHPDLSRDPSIFNTLASIMGRAIWNATPLPGHHFRPAPLPAPGRNDPCPCGSRRKYKQCCANAPSLPPLDTEEVWPLVVDLLSPKMLQQAIKQQRIPVMTLAMMAEDFAEEGRALKGIALLEPLFKAPIAKTDDRQEYVMNILCDLYDDCGSPDKKSDLLQHIVDSVPRSPLRAGAWQRLATICIDKGDSEGAWEAFRHAQRDDPDSLGIGLLEVQLLIGENRPEQARDRAQFWVKRLRRQGMEDDEQPLSFLLAAVSDPMQAMADVGTRMSGAAGQRMQAWLMSVMARPVPVYQMLADEETDADAADISSEMESSGEQLDIFGELPEDFPDDEVPEEILDGQVLVPPSPLAALEAQWHEIFPLDKPFSVHDIPFEAADPWEPQVEEVWMAFLEQHPEAFDSLDILDDLATAVLLHEHANTPWLDQLLLEPVLRRGEAIIEQAVAGVDRPHLLWWSLENRPALRSLLRLIMLDQRCGEDEAARLGMERLLSLNPNDNHGFRMLLMDDYLRSGDDAAALALAGRYPDDHNPEIMYGQVLALFRLGRLEEANSALAVAVERMPKLVRHITHQRVRKPTINPMGISLGGDDQAWLYRETMRDVWLATPGVIEWMKKAAKRLAAS